MGKGHSVEYHVLDEFECHVELGPGVPTPTEVRGKGVNVGATMLFDERAAGTSELVSVDTAGLLGAIVDGEGDTETIRRRREAVRELVRRARLGRCSIEEIDAILSKR